MSVCLPACLSNSMTHSYSDEVRCVYITSVAMNGREHSSELYLLSVLLFAVCKIDYELPNIDAQKPSKSGELVGAREELVLSGQVRINPHLLFADIGW
mmetsp:Transcript_22046/g.32493  ORF Transcript_22046/g.32493 Transcript_22046/m.32493 type:complete len:98 (-) Transcript_22046:590-883(-)